MDRRCREELDLTEVYGEYMSLDEVKDHLRVAKNTVCTIVERGEVREWIAAQENRENDTPTCNGAGISSAEILPGGSGAGEGGSVDVMLNCGDGTTSDRPGFGVAVNVVDDPGTYERILSLDEIEAVRGYL